MHTHAERDGTTDAAVTLAVTILYMRQCFSTNSKRTLETRDLFIILVVALLLEEADKRLRDLEEVLLALRLGALLEPVDDCLVRDTVGIVQNLEELRERLEDSSVLVAVDLECVDDVDLRLGAVGERLKSGGESSDKGDDVGVKLVGTSRPVETAHPAEDDPLTEVGLWRGALRLLDLEVLDDLKSVLFLVALTCSFVSSSETMRATADLVSSLISERATLAYQSTIWGRLAFLK